MLKRLTDKQKTALQIAVSNPYLSYRDLAELSGIGHVSFFERIAAVIKKGYIEKRDGRWRMTKTGSAQLLMDLATNRFKKTNK